MAAIFKGKTFILIAATKRVGLIQVLGTNMSNHRKCAILFAFVALSFLMTPATLIFLDGPGFAGNHLRFMVTEPSSRIIMMVTILPAIWASLVATALWRLAPSASQPPRLLVFGSIAVCCLLLLGGYVLLGIIFIAATVPLAFSRNSIVA